jgi:hypothetical protein
LSDQRQKRPREDAGACDAARPPDVVASGVAGVDAGELQRSVRLDRDRQIRRALEPDGPRAVAAPARKQFVGKQPVCLAIA